uniref:Putative oxidoreductase n=1 Tax=Paulinella longichromatophora TaxID=1708747 RepID=A0A2H4ZNZ2_9EUKA|nr:putative oxidoreductase [Paulinella longichromatophora]
MLISQPIRIAIAGSTLGERVHWQALQTSSSIQLVALWHPCHKSPNNIKLNPELSVYSDFNLLLNDLRIEAVIIATCPKCYFNLATAALNANKHVLLDTPIDLTITQIKQLQQLALEKKLKIAVNFVYRAVPLFQQLAHLIHNGVLGDPYLIKVDWLIGYDKKNHQQIDWYQEKNVTSNVIDRMGIHIFDLLHWFMGPISSITTLHSTVLEEKQLDTITNDIKSANIALIQITLKSLTDLIIPAQINLSSRIPNGRGFWIEFYGSESTLIIGNENQSDSINDFGLWMAPKGQSLRRLPIDPSLSFDLIWDQCRVAPASRIQYWWAISIRTNQPMIPGLTEAYWSKYMCELTEVNPQNSRVERLIFSKQGFS